MGKSLKISFTPRERFAVFLHFTQNVTTRTAREQDEYSEIWESLNLDEIDDAVSSLGRNATSQDFVDEDPRESELTKDEIAYFVKFLSMPMPGVTSRLIRPIRVRISEVRDRAGLKSLPVDEEAV